MYSKRSINLSFAVVTALISSLLAISPTVANAAADGPVNCGTSGTFTILNDTVVSSDNCVGAAAIPAGVTVTGAAFASSPGLTNINFDETILGSPWSASSTVRVTGRVNCGDSGFFYIYENSAQSRFDCVGSVVIPAGVTSIADQAFDAHPDYGGLGYFGYYAGSSIPTSISALTIPNTVTYIGEYAFRYSRMPSLVIPDSVTHIGNYTFNGSLMSSLTVGNGLSTIALEAFSGMGNLTSLTIGTGVREIGQLAFAGAYALSELTIPNTVDLIGDSAFAGVVSPFTLNYCGNAPLANTGLPDPSSNVASCSPAPPQSVTASPSTDSVTIGFTPGLDFGDPITNYEYSLNGAAFTPLSPASTESPFTLSNVAFGNSYTLSLRAVTATGPGAASLPIQFIVGLVAYSDPAVSGVTVPVAGQTPAASVTGTTGYEGAISWSGASTFFGLTDSYSATITLTANPGYTFVGVPANYFTVAGATSVTHAANSGVITATFPGSDTGTFNCGTSGIFTIVSFIVDGNSGCVGPVTIPNGVTEIRDFAFEGTTDITSVLIPSSVTRIQEYAFADATSLASVTFAPNSQLTQIDNEAFQGATALQSIAIPDGVLQIRRAAFRNATSLSSVTFGANSQLTYIHGRVFEGASALEEIAIPDGVTTIDEYAFQNATALRSVSFGAGSVLANLNQYAFDGASSLESIAIPDNVTSIRQRAFRNATSLRTVTFGVGSDLESIETEAFQGASSLEAIAIPDPVDSIGERAFQNATSLESVAFGVNSALEHIDVEVFDGASSLQSIAIPDGVFTIRARAFRNATSLSSVTFGVNSALYVIQEEAFDGASALEEINIPSNVMSIDHRAFRNATSLRSVTFADGIPLGGIGEHAFRGTTSLTDIQVPGWGLESERYIFLDSNPAVFSRSYIDWRAPISTLANPPRIGETVFASAFERELTTALHGHVLEEYVYRITRQENTPTTSVDVQTNGDYHSLSSDQQNQWYEGMGFDPASAPANNPYRFSWRAFMCVSDVNGIVTLSKPGNLYRSYASRDQVPAGTSSESHSMMFWDATERLNITTSPSTRTVVGTFYDTMSFDNGSSTYAIPDLLYVDPYNAPYSFGISQVDANCGNGKTLEALEIVEAGGTSPITTKQFTISPQLRLKYENSYFSQDAAGLTIGVSGNPYLPVNGAYSAALWGLTTIAAPSVITPQGFSYAGPLVNTFFPRLLETNKAYTVRIFGLGLDQVKAMSYKNIDLSFSIISSREIEVQIPALSVGIKEIKFDAGAAGIVTHINALEVREPYQGAETVSPTPEPTIPGASAALRTSTIWGFVAGTTRLDSAGTKNLKAVTRGLATAKEISCVGYTMGPKALARDVQLSYNRAMVVCKRLAASIPGVKIIKVEGRQDSRIGDRVRRVEIKWRR